MDLRRQNDTFRVTFQMSFEGGGMGGGAIKHPTESV